jgi:hypothetical protein
MYQGASLRVDVWQCARTYSGQRPCRQDGRCAPSAFPRTATDGPRWRRVPGLRWRAEPGCAFPVRPPPVRAVPGTRVGRPGRGRPRVRSRGARPGRPCGDAASLLSAIPEVLFVTRWQPGAGPGGGGGQHLIG